MGAARIKAGGIGKKAVRRVVHHNANQIRYCYARSLQRSDGLVGKVAIRWTIGPDGRVSATKITDNTVADPKLAECMRRKIARWRFPVPKDGKVAVVHFPWVFESAG